MAPIAWQRRESVRDDSFAGRSKRRFPRRCPHQIHTYVVGSRQDRPNLPSTTCPFCPGGLEAPDDYDVRWFPQPLAGHPGRSLEVVLYTPEHDATFYQ